MAIVADDGAYCIPIREEHLRYLGADKDVASLTLDVVRATAAGGIQRGGNDEIMTPEWEKVKPATHEDDESHWFRSKTGGGWHCWGVIIDPKMIVKTRKR